MERRQQPGRRLDQDDAGAAWVYGAEIGCERALRELGNGTGHLHPGRSAADHDEVEKATPLVRIPHRFGTFEGQQNPAAQVGRVVDRLQAGGKGRPVVAEIGMLGAGRHDEKIERNAASLGDDLPAHRIDTGDLRQDDARVALAAKNPAYGRGDVAG